MEAIRLALEYNFVTEVTSMVVEENDDYVKTGVIGSSQQPSNNPNESQKRQMRPQYRSMTRAYSMPNLSTQQSARSGRGRGNKHRSYGARSGRIQQSNMRMSMSAPPPPKWLSQQINSQSFQQSTMKMAVSPMMMDLSPPSPPNYSQNVQSNRGKLISFYIFSGYDKKS